MQDHDKHLEAFLNQCEERNLKLNDKKIKLRLTEVPFIGHVATADGLSVDPHKVKAIQEMLEFSVYRTCTVFGQVPALLVRHHKIIEKVNGHGIRHYEML